jgi:SulP family sulfate permease
MPKSVLASIVIAAVIGLFNIPYVKELYRLHRNDFYILMITFLLTLILGVQNGVFAGIFLSLILILYKATHPHYAILGKLKDKDAYRNIKRYPDAHSPEGVLIFRYDNDLFFGNAEHFYDTVMKELRCNENTELFIFNAKGTVQIDSSGLHKLSMLIDHVRNRGIRFMVTGLRGPARDLLFKSGLMTKIGSENNFLNISDALTCAKNHIDPIDMSNEYAAQHFHDKKKKK